MIDCKNLIKNLAMFIAVVISFPAFPDESQQEKLEQSLGAVIVVADREEALEFGYGFPNLNTSKKIDEVYKKTVSKLDTKYRIQFFWGLVFNLSLEGHYSEELIHLIHKDCGKEF